MPTSQSKISLTQEDRVVNMVSIIVSTIMLIVTVYPIYYVFIYAFSDGQAALANQIYIAPASPTLDNFREVFKDSLLVNGFVMNVYRTVAAVLTSVMFTGFSAYALTREELIGRKVYTMIALFTMYFGGGLIPTFLLYRGLKLINTFWVYIVPGLLSVYNMMLCMAFFREIPSSLIESARLDGAGEIRVFLQIMLPLSMPILATIALFVGVGAWNDWFTSAYFVSSKKLMTLPTILMRLISAAAAEQKAMQQAMESGVHIGSGSHGVTSTSIRYATMLVTIVPIMCVYPFLQKYFVKGVMVGAIKA